MSRRKSGRGGSASPIIGVVLLVALAVLAWYAWQRQRPVVTTKSVGSAENPKSLLTVAADRVDPANEGRTLNVNGIVRSTHPARDAQLAIGGGTDAIVLLRRVEMLQWREQCAGASCGYALAWSEQPIDSNAFRQRKGHDNATHFPFISTRFVADDLRIGAYRLDAALTTQVIDTAAPVALPVHASQLPPNLAATFRERDGVLYASSVSGAAAAGDLRVSYRIVAASAQRIVGVQVGDRLKAVPSSTK